MDVDLKDYNMILLFQFLNSLDAKEIYLEIMHNLPDFELLSANTLEVIFLLMVINGSKCW